MPADIDTNFPADIDTVLPADVDDNLPAYVNSNLPADVEVKQSVAPTNESDLEFTAEVEEEQKYQLDLKPAEREDSEGVAFSARTI